MQYAHGTKLCFANISSLLTEFMETDAAARFCEYLPPVFDISVCFGIHRSPHDLLGRSIGGRRCAYIQLIPDEAG